MVPSVEIKWMEGAAETELKIHRWMHWHVSPPPQKKTIDGRINVQGKNNNKQYHHRKRGQLHVTALASRMVPWKYPCSRPGVGEQRSHAMVRPGVSSSSPGGAFDLNFWCSLYQRERTPPPQIYSPLPPAPKWTQWFKFCPLLPLCSMFSCCFNFLKVLYF